MSRITTKEEYEELLNDALGTDIEWSRMLKEDLVEFKDTLLDPEKLEQIYMAITEDERPEIPDQKFVRFGKKLIKNWQGPMVSKAKEVYRKFKKIEEMEGESS